MCIYAQAVCAMHFKIWNARYNTKKKPEHHHNLWMRIVLLQRMHLLQILRFSFFTSSSPIRVRNTTLEVWTEANQQKNGTNETWRDRRVQNKIGRRMKRTSSTTHPHKTVSNKLRCIKVFWMLIRDRFFCWRRRRHVHESNRNWNRIECRQNGVSPCSELNLQSQLLDTKHWS